MTSTLLRRTRFQWNADANSFETDLPAHPWTPADDSIGGVRIAASGLAASYVVRRDYLVDLELRIHESFWPDLLAFVIAGQGAVELKWFPDALESTYYLVYLQSPAPGSKFSPTRSEFPRVFEVSLTLRGIGTAPWTPYFV